MALDPDPAPRGGAAPSPTDDDAAPVLTLARELIARPSVTPDDAGCLEIIGERLPASVVERIVPEGFGISRFVRIECAAQRVHGVPAPY